MKNSKTNPAHVTHGNVLDDLALSPEKAAALKIKVELHRAIIAIVTKNRYSQRDLQRILAQPQPRISELLNGKISKTSVEKLLEYLSRLGASVKVQVGRTSAVSSRRAS